MLIQPRSEEDHQNIIEQGFTLVELLIVIVILGILAGIVVFAVGGLTDDASKNACKTDASTFTSAYQAFKAHNNGSVPAPATVAGVKAALIGNSNGGPYMQSWPSTVDEAHSGSTVGAADPKKWVFDSDDGSVTATCA